MEQQFTEIRSRSFSSSQSPGRSTPPLCLSFRSFVAPRRTLAPPRRLCSDLTLCGGPAQSPAANTLHKHMLSMGRTPTRSLLLTKRRPLSAPRNGCRLLLSTPSPQRLTRPRSAAPLAGNLRHAQSLNDLRLHPLQERRRERGTRLSATSKLARVSQGDDGGLELNVGTQKASPSSPRRHLSRQPPQSPSSFHRQMSAPSSISPGAGGKGPAPGSKRDSGDGSPDVGCSNASDVSLHEALNFAPSTNPPDAPSRSGCITAACDGALALVWHNEEGRRDEGILLAVHLNGEYLNAVGVGFGGR